MVVKPTVKVYSRELHLDLATSGMRNMRAMKQGGIPATPSTIDTWGTGTVGRSHSVPPTQQWGQQGSRRGASGREQPDFQRTMASLVAKSRQKLEEHQAAEEVALQHMLAANEKEEATFVQDLGNYLEARDRSRLHRKSTLCREWQEKVYQHIQTQIDEQLDAISSEQLTARRRQLMEDYIRTSNMKTYGLYRDIILEHEFDQWFESIVLHDRLVVG